MISVQVVPAVGKDARRLLRERMRRAQSFEWTNRRKTRLRHKAYAGYIQVESAAGVLVAFVKTKDPKATWGLVEKFVGRVTDWLADEIVAINIQLQGAPPAPKKKRRRSRAR